VNNFEQYIYTGKVCQYLLYGSQYQSVNSNLR